ncbi:histone-lysine N-methyltransferase SETMAR [Trichonephila clavipes]|nr:histone-lysine N-methyltransferase SETMAR [Trichonephila clavipes]
MTAWTLYLLEWDLRQQPPYSPDMAPSNYYLFSHLQLHLGCAIFRSYDVINEADRYLDSRKAQFFTEMIEILPNHWQTIVDRNGSNPH